MVIRSGFDLRSDQYLGLRALQASDPASGIGSSNTRHKTSATPGAAQDLPAAVRAAWPVRPLFRRSGQHQRGLCDRLLGWMAEKSVGPWVITHRSHAKIVSLPSAACGSASTRNGRRVTRARRPISPSGNRATLVGSTTCDTLNTGELRFICEARLRSCTTCLRRSGFSGAAPLGYVQGAALRQSRIRSVLLPTAIGRPVQARAVTTNRWRAGTRNWSRCRNSSR